MSFRSIVFSAALAFAMGGATITVMQPAAFAQSQGSLPAGADEALVASSGTVSDLSAAAAQLIATNPGYAAEIVKRAIELRPDSALQITAIGAGILPEQAGEIAGAAASANPGAAAGIATIAATSAPNEAVAIVKAVSAAIDSTGASVDAVAGVVAGVQSVVPEKSQELVGAAAEGSKFTEGEVTEALLNVSEEDVQEIRNQVNSALEEAAAILAELENRLDGVTIPRAEPGSLSGG